MTVDLGTIRHEVSFDERKMERAFTRAMRRSATAAGVGPVRAGGAAAAALAAGLGGSLGAGALGRRMAPGTAGTPVPRPRSPIGGGPGLSAMSRPPSPIGGGPGLSAMSRAASKPRSPIGGPGLSAMSRAASLSPWERFMQSALQIEALITQAQFRKYLKAKGITYTPSPERHGQVPPPYITGGGRGGPGSRRGFIDFSGITSGFKGLTKIIGGIGIAAAGTLVASVTAAMVMLQGLAKAGDKAVETLAAFNVRIARLEINRRLQDFTQSMQRAALIAPSMEALQRQTRELSMNMHRVTTGLSILWNRLRQFFSFLINQAFRILDWGIGLLVKGIILFLKALDKIPGIDLGDSIASLEIGLQDIRNQLAELRRQHSKQSTREAIKASNKRFTDALDQLSAIPEVQ